MSESPILCPHCGSPATLPLPGLADKVGAVFGLAFGRSGKDLSFANPDLVREFQAGRIEALCKACRRRFNMRTHAPATSAPAGAASPARPAERLRELEKLRAEQLITDEEYQRKRQDILRSL